MNKNRLFYGVIGGLSLLLLILSFFMRKTINERDEIDHQIESKLEELKALALRTKMAPSNEITRQFDEKEIELENKYLEILKTIDKGGLEKEMSPLEFKEELLKTQDFLKERARIWNIQVPQSVGFREFEAGVIPEEKDIWNLSYQLSHIRNIVNLMVESKISRIDSIVKSVEVVDQKSKGLNAKQIFMYQFKMQCNWSSLIQILTRLHGSRQFFLVKKIEVTNEDKDSLLVMMTVEAILFETVEGDKK